MQFQPLGPWLKLNSFERLKFLTNIFDLIFTDTTLAQDKQFEYIIKILHVYTPSLYSTMTIFIVMFKKFTFSMSLIWCKLKFDAFLIRRRSLSCK